MSSIRTRVESTARIVKTIFPTHAIVPTKSQLTLVAKLKKFRFAGLPTIEVYRTTRVDATHEMNHTEIYIQVSRVKSKAVIW